MVRWSRHQKKRRATCGKEGEVIPVASLWE
jgi:hypothetical protein